ncbi:TIGR02450 family Trp-rich protein [Motilimonas pumila]|uniref:TIGR02450 family Trp-rich protein n=1 Tax=Motilimonas pumila TaxID=2303987 RepID=A0A418YG21_9GAMM|nr:TIGR02450 family Trp-rich protein [Motilimonas pumila]RJG48417.1 TIGR02450 family Trp-rich protein [Motilimonas pumila]
MNKITPKKLLHSKWTAANPKRKEKHFMITEVEFDEEGVVVHCLMEAIMTKREIAIDWHSLKDSELWRQGWK